MAGEKILSIDDSPTVQRLIDMILSSQGYQVVLASDGEEGIVKAKAEKPAVVLVDFVMPKMNGFQVCKTLKEDPEFKDTPIILVTSKGDKVGSKFVDVLGITEYFTKPFQPEELLAKIREAIDKKTPATPKTEARPLTPPPPTPPSQPLPVAGIEAMVREVVERTLEDFVKNALPDMIRRELGKNQPAPNAGIKGNLANFRIIEVMQMLGLQRQTGKLAISRGSDDVEIYFRDGAVVFAASNCAGGTSVLDGLLRRSCRLKDDQITQALRTSEKTSEPIDAVLARERLIDPKTFLDCLNRYTENEIYKAMAWREGNFVFEKVSPPAFANPLRLKVDDLLLEGARRADEWMLIQQRIPNFSIAFEPLIGNADELTRRGMSDTDTRVFSLIDGKRSVQDIIDASCLGEFDVAKSMFILLSVNLIRKKK
jgi:CheY-like chemotaxis protein